MEWMRGGVTWYLIIGDAPVWFWNRSCRLHAGGSCAALNSSISAAEDASSTIMEALDTCAAVAGSFHHFTSAPACTYSCVSTGRRARLALTCAPVHPPSSAWISAMMSVMMVGEIVESAARYRSCTVVVMDIYSLLRCLPS